MASLSSAKTIGGIGGLLVFIPGLSFVGWILILVALNDIAKVVQDRSIFDDGLVAVIMAILGSVVLSLDLFPGAFSSFVGLGGFPFGPAAILTPLVVALGVFWVFAVISAIFLKRVYDKAAQRLNIHAFATAGLLYLIGALTSIVLVGFVILLIALTFQVVAYFSVEDRPAYSGVPPSAQPFAPPPSAVQQPTVTQQAQSQSKFCPKCGARLARIADYCTNCGTKQP